MRLRTFAEIATILALAVALLSYLKIEPNVLDEIPELHRSQAERDVKDVDLKINEKDYAGAKAGLYHQYKAAIAMNSAYNKDSALSSVIENSLAVGDYRIAILSGKEIFSNYSKSVELSKIVDSALRKNETIGFAVVAAELIPSSYSKDVALQKIVEHYNSGNRAASSKPTSQLDIYKEIFRFADSSADMGMSENEAKEFADRWMESRSYEEFEYFKKVYQFADSTAKMDMSDENAKKFALAWIDKYTEEEFKIFSSAFEFADSNSGMGMSEADAQKFAFKKVEEYRHTEVTANKPLQPKTQGNLSNVEAPK